MNIAAYAERIHYARHLKPDVETLLGLHLAHMRSIPFENLDIGLKRPIKIDQASIWNKLITQERGGFCYELNGLFAWLLEQIGFDVTYLNARVFNRAGDLGIDFDHLALLVKIPDPSMLWLADVGFGDSFNEPLRLNEPGEQVQGLRAYRLEKTPDGFITWQRNFDGSWERLYFFDLQPHKFPEEYELACLYHQTSPKSSFTRGSIISKSTHEGRISLEYGRLIITTNGQRTERPLEGKQEFHRLLKANFDVILPQERS